MIFYFTYNDQPSGVYFSQVCDVVEFMDKLPGERVRLFALVSGRAWRSIRKDIRKRSPDAIVWPMVPWARNWKLNSLLLGILRLWYRPYAIIARGVFAVGIARRSQQFGGSTKVCFDGRGAYAAEWNEYRIIDDDQLISQVSQLEREAVCLTDFRIAVSNALVAYWNTTYAYDSDRHVVIPCTLSAGRRFELDDVRIKDIRTQLTYAPDDVVLVYAGSTAGWQSFDLLQRLLTTFLEKQPETKLLFLSKMDDNIRTLMKRFPERVQVRWLNPEEVHDTLSAADYGILVREGSITNKVASPTKYAEYLAAGLKILISPSIGDMSKEATECGLGVLWEGSGDAQHLTAVSFSEKQSCAAFALEHYTKGAHRGSYVRLKNDLVSTG